MNTDKGFFKCLDCGALVERKNSKQCRCEKCQEASEKKTKEKK